jgi:AAA family ATP:ADP antiporter
MPSPIAAARPDPLLRLLGARPGEGAALAWSFVYFFCLLTGYYVLRPVRDAVGADYQLQLLFTATFLCMVALTPIYGALVSRYPRRVFLPVVYGFFVACLLLFHLAFRFDVPFRAPVFFVWVAVFNLFAVSVFWSFMSDIFEHDQAKRFYGTIAAGGTAGALVGPTLTTLLVAQIGIANLLLISAALLGVCLVAMLKLNPRALAQESRRGTRSGDEAMGGSMLAGIRLIGESRFLTAVCVLMFFGVGVGTLLYYEQAAITRLAYPDRDERTAFYAAIDLAINVLVLATQVSLTRVLLTRYGVAPLLLIPSALVLAGFVLLTASPLPLLVAAVQVVTRAGNFAMIQPARESLFTRVDRESRYKAKSFIDTVVYRAGDLGFGWFHAGLMVLGFSSAAVFGVGVAVALGLGFGASWIARLEKGLPASAPGEGPKA